MSRPDPANRPEPVFDEPWQAAAFAMAVALQDRGVIAAGDWAAALGAQLHAPDAAAAGSDYYRRWLAALEDLLVEKGLVEQAALDETTAAWQRAAAATPHGQPLDLANDPARRP